MVDKLGRDVSLHQPTNPDLSDEDSKGRGDEQARQRAIDDAIEWRSTSLHGMAIKDLGSSSRRLTTDSQDNSTL
jgi:hypothetical protein